MSASKRIVIFALDGTLVDNMGPAADLFCSMVLVNCGVPDEVSRPIFTQLMGKGPKAQFAAVLRQVEASDKSLVADLTRRYWLLAEEHVPQLFPEVQEVLEGLSHDGHILIVSSGSIPSSALRKTRVTGVERLFRLVLGSDEDVPGLAKGPGHFAMITQALSLTAAALQNNAVFVGDGVYDMEVARDAGIVGVGRVTDGNHDVLVAAGASYLIEDLRGLRPILGQAG